MRHALSLRARFVSIALVGAVLPLALVGFWQIGEIERSGETLLHQRLDDSLRRMVADIGARWVAQRSELLTLGEHEVVQATVRRGLDSGLTSDASLAAAYDRLQHSFEAITLRDLGGTHRWALMGESAFGSRVTAAGATVNASIELFDRASSQRLGALDVRIPLARIVPPDAGVVASVGAVLAVIDRATGALLTPLPFDAPLLAGGEFVWGGERWLTSRASLDEPPLDLVAAAPVTPFAQPFQRAARRGVAALGLVLIAALVTTVLLTRKTTQALRDLAHAATEISKGHYERTVATDADDEVGQVAGAFNIMTASLRRTLDELAERRSFAAVGEFASSLAHEVRNPLTSIRLDLQRLEEKVAGDPRLSEPVARALRSVVRLDATVTGVLRVARSGQLSVDRVDVRESLEAALKDVESETRARGVLLTREDAKSEVWITGDRSALHQLFLNLVLNAVQATGTGGRVHVGVTVETDVVRVSISNSGAGIAAEAQSRVFDPFYSTKDDGTGLGLTIARRIAEAHGGSITLESHADRGTTALVRLPLRSDA